MPSARFVDSSFESRSSLFHDSEIGKQPDDIKVPDVPDFSSEEFSGSSGCKVNETLKEKNTIKEPKHAKLSARDG